MNKEKLSEAAQAAFLANYDQLISGAATTLPECEIDAVDSLKALSDLPPEIDPDLLDQTVMVKLNGGLGTGMGLEKAKSLLAVKGKDTFLDFITKQVLHMRGDSDQGVKFLFMNSFSTSADTLAHLSRYTAQLKQESSELEFVQNKSPKVLISNLYPAQYPENTSQEWCPPGHGDLYAALLGSGTLDQLRKEGKKYMFVSNADNLGATLNVQILTYFSESNAPFMMEVCKRTATDKKGGHLCRSKQGGLLLRESAQCAPEDEAAFQDVSKHKYFNTNNLWINLDALHDTMTANKGTMPLALIKNSKTVNPRDTGSEKVFQLETAMGAAIASFKDAQAIEMPRSRFAPVKSCSDLLSIRSDAFVVTPEQTLELDPSRDGVPPEIQLDDRYKFVDRLDEMLVHGVPSLLKCTKLTVEGWVVFGSDVTVVGQVKFVNDKEAVWEVASGIYTDEEVRA